jgi:DNA-directed RNA polymerase
MLINLSDTLDKESPLLIEAHNAFLQALLKRALAEGAKEQHLTVFFMWYEDKMRIQYNINGDVTTFAMLLKGSLAKKNQLHSQRYIKRFVHFWKTSMGSIGEVLESTVLSDQDVIDIAQVCPR